MFSFLYSPSTDSSIECNNVDVDQRQQIGKLYYQSPIDFKKDELSFKIHQKMYTKGKNSGATLLPDKIYQIQAGDEVLLHIDNRVYMLDEYHFHHEGCKGSEHAIDGKKVGQAELHYVFIEIPNAKHVSLHDQCKYIKNYKKKRTCCTNICKESCEDLDNSDEEEHGNFLVIARFIEFDKKCNPQDLTKLQVQIPTRYFETNGSLTGSLSTFPKNYSAVRWIVGIKPLKMSANDFNKTNSKSVRSLQNVDGRIILYN